MIAQPGESSVIAYLQQNRLELTPDGQHIRWSHGNAIHPRNWPVLRKSFDTGLICLLDLLLFLLGQVVGTIVLPPWSEAFGRKKLYLISSALSCVCCAIIGGVQSLAAVIVGRVFAGLIAAIPYTVGMGSVEDMWSSRPRIWVTFLWTIASNLGLCVGPIMGTYISVFLNWRWLFYIYAIMIAVIAALFLFTRESRPSLLLSREVEKMRHHTGSRFQALNHDYIPGLRTFVKVSLFRPAILFFREPLVFVVSVMVAFAFSLLYIFTEALQPIYEALGFTRTQSSLAFVAIACGIWFSSLTRILDNRIIDTRHRNQQPVKPEDKLLGLAIGAPVLAVSMWWFGWTIPPRQQDVHWIVPSIPLAMMGYALNEFDTVLYGYLGDCYLSYSASATAAVAFLRALLSGVFPLFTKQMFEALTPNVAVSVLAALATMFCIAPPLFMCYGERIRGRSPFAKHSIEVEAELGNKDEGY
ncbi:major facilitator superfamily domain-containing protein [Aspergillus alliaceus]|uniref:Major facilitator superfamily domain-containing protein n=1 Tax=Petromyces alliaceus TaxID=209559 RepID=A0A5N7C6L8_PETAA|nr:major facilitator superfamily domain-containing protein [Aspergillus alliaceus]